MRMGEIRRDLHLDRGLFTQGFYLLFQAAVLFRLLNKLVEGDVRNPD